MLKTALKRHKPFLKRGNDGVVQEEASQVTRENGSIDFVNSRLKSIWPLSTLIISVFLLVNVITGLICDNKNLLPPS